MQSLLIPTTVTKCTVIISVVSLLWTKNEEMLSEMAMAAATHMVTVIEPIIQDASWLFPMMVFSSAQFSSVAQLCPTLCDPMNSSTPGLPVHHQLLEFTQAQCIGALCTSAHEFHHSSHTAHN